MRKLLHVSLTVLLSISFSLMSQGGVTSAAAQRATIESQTVYTTPDGFLLGDPVPGAYATLTRNSHGLTTNVHTFVESGKGVYSLWWIVYNNPAACATYLCTFDNPDFVSNATGKIVPNGNLNFSASVSPGGPYSGEVLVGDPGLTNLGGAMVWLIVRYHGPAQAGHIPEQLSTYLGGCPFGGAPCVDEQIIVFPGECSGPCLVPFP